jgi:hypothetical protein
LVGARYARIVALMDGSGRIEIYDALTRSWSGASADECTFSDLWTAAPAPLGVFERLSAYPAETDQ